MNIRHLLSPDIPALERRGIAPHRGDVTTVLAANRLKAMAAQTSATVQRQQQPPVTAREALRSEPAGQILL